MNITGYAILNDRKVVFSFENNTITLFTNLILDDGMQNKSLFDNIVQCQDNHCITGCDLSGNTYIFFTDGNQNDSTKYTTLSFYHTSKIDVYAYIKYNSIISAISGMGFYGKEINQFYSLNKGYTVSTNLENAKVEIKPYKDTINNFSFNFNNENITCNFGVENTIQYGSSTPILSKSQILLRFNETTSFEKLFSIYNIINNFLSFIAYRTNIDINMITLYGKTTNSDFSKIGELYVCSKENIIESDYVIERTISIELIKEHIENIMNDIASESLYVEHIPKSKHDKHLITPARFILITAAFEYNFNKIYDIPLSSKQETVKNDLLDAIKELPENKSYNNELKKKHKYFIKLISNTKTNLSNKIQYALKDLNQILKPFIEYLYNLNNQNFEYSAIGERLQEQRNNFAHGNIDKELKSEIILDITVLEWVNYAIVLKGFGYSEHQITSLIARIFNLGYHSSISDGNKNS